MIETVDKKTYNNEDIYKLISGIGIQDRNKKEYDIMEQLLLDSENAEQNIRNAKTLVGALEKAEIHIWNKFTDEIEKIIDKEINKKPTNKDKWKIVYETCKSDKNGKTYYLNISSDDKVYVRFLMLPNNEWENKEIFENEQFDFAELADKTKFEKRIHQCINFIRQNYNA